MPDHSEPVFLNRTTLITGASRGLGAEIARHFWRNGSDLALVARSQERLEGLRQELLSEDRPAQRLWVFPADLSDAAARSNLLPAVRQRTGRLDVLVNNAAILGPIGPFWQNPTTEWETTFQTNLFAPAQLMREAIPWMAAQGGGSIINLSGGGATAPRPNFSAYASAKTALVRLSETVAAEALGLNVRVNCIAPGAMNTEMLEAVLNSTPQLVGSEFAKAVTQKQQGGADPATPAALCLYLASAAATAITGKLISAVWDPWRDLEARIPQLVGSDVYTLRRIVPADRGEDW